MCTNGYMPISKKRRGKYGDSEHILGYFGARYIQSKNNCKMENLEIS